MRRITINLASHPLRNRKFYFFVLSCLGLGVVVTFFFSASLFLFYYQKGKAAKESLAEVESSILLAQREEKRLASKVEDAFKKDKEKVDLMNSIILKKSFPWRGFFSLLENSLPDSSYILSLAPDLVDSSRLEMRFKVVSRHLDDLLLFLNNLYRMNFKQIRVESEDQSSQGQLISEISLSYERTL